MKNIDTNEALQICHFGNGIKLKQPGQNQASQLTIGSVLKLPFPVYLNSNHKIINCNEHCAELSGFVSIQDCLGKEWFKPYKSHTILSSLRHEKDVIANNKYKIIEDILLRKDDVNVHALSVKMPWYNNENKIIGLFGYSVFLGKHSLAESLSQAVRLGLLKNTNNNKILPQESFYFSPREQDILRCLVRGKTARETGIILGLSRRTVEHYLENSRLKTNSLTKSELIEKIFDYFDDAE